MKTVHNRSLKMIFEYNSTRENDTKNNNVKKNFKCYVHFKISTIRYLTSQKRRKIQENISQY